MINKIQAETVDFCGTIEDVQRRMDDSVILIESPEAIRNLIRKAKWYDAVETVRNKMGD